MAAGDGDYNGGNTTGFVSPAGDALEGPIDHAEALDLRRPNRYPVRVWGEALRERGIHPGDILIADAAAAPATGKVCVAFVHGEVLVATLAFRRGAWWLYPSAEGPEPVAVAGEAAEVWAIVCGLVRTDV
jgi:DNA polymerase V